MGDVQIEVVEHFKYHGSLKSANGNCNSDIESRIGLAKKRMFDMVPIWRDRGINKELNIEPYNNVIVHSLLRTVSI